jgi:hypothetical protein
MQRKIRAFEHGLVATLNSIADAVITTDLKGTVTYLNPAAERLTGWHHDEAVGQSTEDVFRIEDENTRESLKNPMSTLLQEGIVMELGSHTLLAARDGSRTPIDDCIAPIRDEQGQVSGVVLVFRDITVRKRADEELRRTREQLGQAQRMEAIGRLVGAVAHDFNNLVTVILGFGKLLLDQAELSSPSRPMLEAIVTSTTRAVDLVRQLQAYGRKQVLRPQIIDLNEVVRSIQPLLQQVLGENIELVTAFAPEPARVLADPGQIQQVMMNLAANAGYAMPGAGQLKIRTANIDIGEPMQLFPETIPPGRYVTLCVDDTGCGMNVETLNHLFEPFFTTKRPGIGTGLGLSSVHGIVKQSGGYVHVHSEVAAGSWFEIYLPRADPAHEAVPAPTPPAGVATGHETILVAEDDDEVRRLVCFVLAKQGYTVLEAAGGPEALELFNAHAAEVDLVLTDVLMPKMSGPQLVDKLMSVRPGIKTLFMSGYSEAAVTSNGSLHPEAAFLAKPFTAESLAAEVRKVLDTPQPCVARCST